KPGTFAIMADGKVRFLPATMPADTFRALCTINGGEKIRNLDEIAPEVPDESANVLRTDAPLALGRTPPAGWQDYSPREGGFSVFLPAGKVEEKSLTLPNPAGNVDVESAVVENSNARFTLVYGIFPNLDKITPEQLLEANRN